MSLESLHRPACGRGRSPSHPRHNRIFYPVPYADTRALTRLLSFALSNDRGRARARARDLRVGSGPGPGGCGPPKRAPGALITAGAPLPVGRDSVFALRGLATTRGNPSASKSIDSRNPHKHWVEAVFSDWECVARRSGCQGTSARLWVEGHPDFSEPISSRATARNLSREEFRWSCSECQQRIQAVFMRVWCGWRILWW